MQSILCRWFNGVLIKQMCSLLEIQLNRRKKQRTRWMCFQSQFTTQQLPWFLFSILHHTQKQYEHFAADVAASQSMFFSLLTRILACRWDQMSWDFSNNNFRSFSLLNLDIPCFACSLLYFHLISPHSRVCFKITAHQSVNWCY